MSIKCIYHDSDFDGWCSGAIIKNKFPEAEMIGMDYGRELDLSRFSKDDIVYMVDYCLQPNEKMFSLIESIKQLVWIDHHKSAIDTLNKECQERNMQIDGLRIVGGPAACQLVWQYLYKDTVVPYFVALLSIYDSYQKECSQFNTAFNMHLGLQTWSKQDRDPASKKWKDLITSFKENTCKPTIDKLIELGEQIAKYDDAQNEIVCSRSAYFINWKGYKFVICNTCTKGAILFKSVDPANYDGMIIYFKSANGIYNVSVYSAKDEVDCSKICKEMGGGGHKGASGFQCKEVPPEFLEAITNKE